ncbi:MAG TPA: endonuclease/exonuclease/phosphatase family protein [Pyrinomonadaceae bacterium]|nr:endonuclease/exonuclease/phosphatase family protein [Pyrinomonadaceae bacterium]
MSSILLILFLLFQLPSHHNGDASLLESGKAATVKTQTTPAQEVKVVSYNIRWRSGDDLKEITKLLREDPEIGSAAILGLQEVDRKKKRSRHSNVAKIMADELGMHYAWAAPPSPESDDEEETGVAILSIYPLSDVKRFVLPHEGPNKRRRAALGATVELGDQKWRVYSIHAETRLNLDKKMEQYKSLLEDLARYPSDMPAIVMGDFNTWEASADRKTIKLFSEAGFRTPFGGHSTFRRRIVVVPIQFRLDWVWLRGLDAASYGIDRKVEISDHWPLWTNVKPSVKSSPAGVKSAPTKQ